MIGAIIVVLLYVALLLLGLSILRRTPHAFARLLGLGILLTIGLQAVINLAVVTGCAPTKGIALPLISSGGTGWVLTAFSLGLLIGIERRDGGAAHPLATSVRPPDAAGRVLRPIAAAD